MRVSLQASGDSAVPRWEDTGIGMAPEDQERVFDEAFRVDCPAVRSLPGTGLGLTIVARLVSQLGGSVRLSSELEVGTSVEVRLPLG